MDLRNDFDRAVQNNEFSKHLKKIFEKKFKLPKVKSDHDDGNTFIIIVYTFFKRVGITIHLIRKYYPQNPYRLLRRTKVKTMILDRRKMAVRSR